MQQADKTTGVQSGINVTPLVDVVLVLLIIFMVIAPQLQVETAVDLPRTEQPPDHPDDGTKIVVTLTAQGEVWIDDEPVAAESFAERMLETAQRRSERKVVIKGDARLTFGDVQRAMFAVERAGFEDVGLITERRDDSG